MNDRHRGQSADRDEELMAFRGQRVSVSLGRKKVFLGEVACGLSCDVHHSRSQ